MAEKPAYLTQAQWDEVLLYDRLAAKDPPGPEDYVICLPFGERSPFDDNHVGACLRCNVGIIFRPWAHEAKKVCVTCAPTVMENNP